MENCLLKSLKGSCDADLLKYGECRFKVVNGKMNLQVLQAPLILTGLNGVLLDGQTTKTISSTGWTQTPIVISGLADDTTIGEISFLNKYNAVRGIACPMVGSDLFPFNGMDIRTFQYILYDSIRATDMTYPTLAKIVEQFPNLIYLTYGGGGASGDVADLLPLAETLTSLDSANMVGQLRSDVHGDFADLGLLKNLTSLGYFITNSKISGSIEGFVAKRMQVKPATAGSITARWLANGGRITYQGEPLVDYNNNTVSWDAQGNITITH